MGTESTLSALKQRHASHNGTPQGRRYLSKNAIVWAAWGRWIPLTGAGFAYLLERGYIVERRRGDGWELNLAIPGKS